MRSKMRSWLSELICPNANASSVVSVAMTLRDINCKGIVQYFEKYTSRYLSGLSVKYETYRRGLSYLSINTRNRETASPALFEGNKWVRSSFPPALC